VATTSDAVIVHLAAPGEPPHRRLLRLDHDCRARARAAALVIAAWLGLPPEPAPIAAPSMAAIGRSDRDVTSRTEARAPRLAAGLGFLGEIDRDGLHPGARLELVRKPRPGTWLTGGIAFAGSLARKASIGAGTARWGRPCATLAAGLEIEAGPSRVRADAGPALGFLFVSGRGHDVDRTDAALSGAAHAGVRFMPSWLGRALWLELRGLFWAAPQRIRIESRPPGDTITLPLPRWQVHGAAGASVDLL
jgi:hypothetical protein